MDKKDTVQKAPRSEWLFGLSGRMTLICSLVLILAFCFSPKSLISTYVRGIAASGLIYAIATLGINFYSGYLGETSLGHAAFFGIGAYMTGYLTVHSGVNFWLTIPIGMAAAAVASVPVAFAGRRVKGSFMVVITYAFCEILRYIVINSESLGTTNGISGIKAPTIFGVKVSKVPFLPTNKDGYILILYALVVFFAWFTWKIINSREGYAISAIREDEIAAQAMGIDVKWYKLKAILISAAICAIAGSFYAALSSLVDPSLLSATLSINIFTMLVIGGRRSIKGAILGALIVVALPELLRGVQGLLKLPFDPWYILYGLMLIIIMRFKPEGLFGVKE